MGGRRFLLHVVDDEGVARRLEIGCHVGAHGADSDEPDLHAGFSSKTCLAIFAADMALGQPA